MLACGARLGPQQQTCGRDTHVERRLVHRRQRRVECRRKVRVVVPDERRRTLIRLESRGVKVEIGRFVNEARRRQVARELRQALRSVSAMR